MTTLVRLLAVAGSLTSMIWFFSSVLLKCGLPQGQGRRLVNRVWAELKYPTLAACILYPILNGPLDVWTIVGTAINLACWWWYRDAGDDEDRWRRRLEKARGKVTRLGNRLVVAPEPARS